MSTAVVFLLLSSSLYYLASGHIRLQYPSPWTTTSAPRSVLNYPCGGDSQSGTVTSWVAGQEVTIELFDQIHHTGNPSRLAISYDGNAMGGYDSCVWLNHIPKQDITGDGKTLKITLTVPDMNCADCTLQLVTLQNSAKTSAQDCCAFDANNKDACATTQYFSCASISITGSRTDREDATCYQPEGWAARNVTCNYYRYEETRTLWEEDPDDSQILWLHSDNSDMREVEVLCASSVLLNPDTSCSASFAADSRAASGVSLKKAPFSEGGEMSGGGIAAIVMVILCAFAVIGTYVFAKKRGAGAKNGGNTKSGATIKPSSQSQAQLIDVDADEGGHDMAVNNDTQFVTVNAEAEAI